MAVLHSTECAHCLADTLGATRALFVASAGNVRAQTHFPASSGLANVLSVTQVDRRDFVTGNAECARQAAGVAGLLVSAAPTLTPKELCAALVRAAAPLTRAGGAAIVRPAYYIQPGTLQCATAWWQMRYPNAAAPE